MSSFRFVSLLGVSVLLLLLLAAVCEAQYYGDFTQAPDYDSDYNATFEYSFYSNASSEDLDRFSERFMDEDDEDGREEEDTGGQQGQEEVTVTMATTRGVTVKGGVHGRSAASPPVSLEIKALVSTLIILMVVNLQQL
ncbi:uncharacterized protein si:ch211-191i18.2 [Amphiprion ocellaris]|uniref:uncharacterized protein si:ch211-191i18.2 n=1 Tax=Amphiprion ocellaris TaxID=80972 RepID=UPI0024115291|nr:uncharacterized protein si:ch211-191i18.2 [Amphiprion ocellaris]